MRGDQRDLEEERGSGQLDYLPSFFFPLVTTSNL